MRLREVRSRARDRLQASVAFAPFAMVGPVRGNAGHGWPRYRGWIYQQCHKPEPGSPQYDNNSFSV